MNWTLVKTQKKVCVGEDEAVKSDLDLHKEDDVKDKFYSQNDLATHHQSQQNCGREDDATMADLDLHKMTKNKQLIMMNEIFEIQIIPTSNIFMYLNKQKPLYFEIKYVGDHHESSWQHKKQLMIHG